jgi:hypothetical protein
MLKELFNNNKNYEELIKELDSKFIASSIINDSYVPKQKLVKQTKFGFYSLDYIEKQFADMRNDIIKFVDKGILPEYPGIDGIYNPKNNYLSYDEGLSISYKDLKINYKEVYGTEDIVKQLTTKFSKSTLSTVAKVNQVSSGLSLSIQPSQKMSREEYIKSDWFRYLLKYVEEYGFLIDHDVPWIIKSNMNSPYVKKNFPTSTFPNYFQHFSHIAFDYYKQYLNYYAKSLLTGMNNPYQYSEYCNVKQDFVLKENYISSTNVTDDQVLKFIVELLANEIGCNSLDLKESIFLRAKQAEGLDNAGKVRYTAKLLQAFKA